jgi:GxxExxY protein
MHPEMLEIEEINRLTQRIIEAAMEVYRVSGPDQEAVSYKHLISTALSEKGLMIETVALSTASDDSAPSTDSDRSVLLIEDQVMIETLAVDQITQDHKDRLLSDLKRFEYHVGLLINFNVRSIEEGIKRLVNY